jgi:hypothetical protein
VGFNCRGWQHSNNVKVRVWGSKYSRHGSNFASISNWFPCGRLKVHLLSFALFLLLWSRNPRQWHPGIHPNGCVGWINWRWTWKTLGIQSLPCKFDLMDYLPTFLPFWRNQYLRDNQSGNFKMNVMHSGNNWRNFMLSLSRMTTQGIHRRPPLRQQLLSNSI